MHAERIEALRCHRGESTVAAKSEHRARWVVVLTGVMMVTELAVGYATRSMALTADGWHMATHAGALGLAAAAYWFARTRATDRSFSFGTGKVHALAGYTSAVALMLVALSMIVESVRRLASPEVIHFREALPVAIVGLIVNLASIKLLDHDDHDHDHDDDHDDDHDHAHAGHDHNHRAAYMHVVADAFTSVLAIAALVAGRYLGWSSLDFMMGIVGGVVVLKWGYGLCRSSGAQLLDATASASAEAAIRAELERVDDIRVADLHLWEMGPNRRSCVVTLVTSRVRDTAFYRDRILAASPLAHLTVEVHRCVDGHEHAP